MFSIKAAFTKIFRKLKEIDDTKDAINGKISRITLFSEYEFQGTVANQWEYIGKSFTVPEGHIYLVRLDTLWNSGKPIGLGIHINDDLESTGIPRYGSVEDENGIQVTPAFFLTAATYYVYAKRATIPSSTNKHYAFAIDIDMTEV